MEKHFQSLVASTKLEPLLIHVPDVLRQEIGVHIIDCLEEFIKPATFDGLKLCACLGSRLLGFKLQRSGQQILYQLSQFLPGSLPESLNVMCLMSGSSRGFAIKAWNSIQSRKTASCGSVLPNLYFNGLCTKVPQN
jgi:hypothetical protein